MPFPRSLAVLAAIALAGPAVSAWAQAVTPARSDGKADGLALRLAQSIQGTIPVASATRARPVALADLARAALARPSSVAIAQAEQAAEAARLAQARAARWPSLSADASLQRQRAEGATTTADVTAGDTTSTQVQLALSWTLFDPARQARIDAQGRTLRAAALAGDEARTDLLTQLLDAYVGAAVADEELSLVEAQIDGLREQAARSSRRLAAGIDSRLDALEVEAFIEALGAERARLRGERELRRASLARLSGMNVEPFAWLRAEWPAALREQAQALWAGERNAASLARLRAVADAAAVRAEAEGDAAAWPTLGLNGSVGRLRQRVGDLPSSNSTNSQVGLQLQWPLDLDGARRARVDEAKAQSQRERAAFDDAVLRVDGAWRTAAAEYEQARRQLEAQDRAAAIARETLAATQRAYVAGLRSGLDLLNATQRSADAQRAALRSRAAMLQALARASALAAPWDAATLERFDLAFLAPAR